MLKGFDKIDSIIIKRPGLKDKKDFDEMNLSEKIEVLSLLIARFCYDEYLKCNGTDMNFAISEIYDKKTKMNLGNVEINWKLNK